MFLKLDGCRIFFDVVGSALVTNGPTMQAKPTLLLLHGGPGLDHSGFRPTFDSLSDIAQVVMLDHRGNGRSVESKTEDWHLGQWADDIKDFCDALGIVKPIVFGHSFGAMVAMRYACRYPDHASKLILAATFAKFDLPALVKRFSECGGDQAANAAQNFWTSPTLENAQVWSLHGLPHYSLVPVAADEMQRMEMSPEVMLHFIAGELHKFNLLPDLTAIKSPTLLLAGSEDPVSSIVDMDKIAEALTHAVVQFECLENASHFLWRDSPERFFEVVRNFISVDASGSLTR